MTDKVVRLSRKAQEAASTLTAALDQSVRKVASQIAADKGKEFADNEDVKEAYKLQIIELARQFQTRLSLQ